MTNFNEKNQKIDVIGIDTDPDQPNPDRHALDADPHPDEDQTGSGSTTLDKDGADLVPEHFRHVRLEFLLLLQRLQEVVQEITIQK